MALSIRTTLIISFLLLIYITSVGGSNGDANRVYSLHKDGFRIHARKLSMLDAVLDYDDAGANPRHEPPRRGRGGRNP
ncbi:hypothetical protein L2E82_21955 [Cichorium intybus]|uniref:Uncharacterized protein n=1 Tax=Cichorium intybus TaxID=13427 RepID=A0ACB9DW70_CICIN|nr:hypothetical protein L2E82_21955 [Cichorium intybus]